MLLSNDGCQQGSPFSCLIFDQTDSEPGFLAGFRLIPPPKNNLMFDLTAWAAPTLTSGQLIFLLLRLAPTSC